jgi:hypothetical protein
VADGDTVLFLRTYDSLGNWYSGVRRAFSNFIRNSGVRSPIGQKVKSHFTRSRHPQRNGRSCGLYTMLFAILFRMEGNVPALYDGPMDDLVEAHFRPMLVEFVQAGGAGGFGFFNTPAFRSLFVSDTPRQAREIDFGSAKNGATLPLRQRQRNSKRSKTGGVLGNMFSSDLVSDFDTSSAPAASSLVFDVDPNDFDRVFQERRMRMRLQERQREEERQRRQREADKAWIEYQKMFGMDKDSDREWS